jgi:hypothetical protein
MAHSGDELAIGGKCLPKDYQFGASLVASGCIVWLAGYHGDDAANP